MAWSVPGFFVPFEVKANLGLEECVRRLQERLARFNLIGGLSPFGGVGGSVNDRSVHLTTPVFGPPWTLYIPAEIKAQFVADSTTTVVRGCVGVTPWRLFLLLIFELAILWGLFVYMQAVMWSIDSKYIFEPIDLLAIVLSLIVFIGVFVGQVFLARRSARRGGRYLLEDLARTLDANLE